MTIPLLDGRRALAPLALALPLATLACGAAADRGSSPAAAVPVRPVRVLAVHPHDAKAFTQGLIWRDGHLFESLGLRGHSALREVDIASGHVLREVKLPSDEFGEGIEEVGGRIFQLTWQEGIVHLWRASDFAPLRTFHIRDEGWGLAWDGLRLIQSDGSSTLYFRSPDDFRVLGSLKVSRDGQPAAYLNEMEYVDGSIYANVWQSDEILRIDPASGRVVEVFDASGLLDPEARAHADVLNGIAWNPRRRIFYLTGKLWPKLFEVELRLQPAERRRSAGRVLLHQIRQEHDAARQ